MTPQSTWWINPILSIDTETTGVDPFNDRIVEIAAVDIDVDGNPSNAWSTIVNPGIDVPDGAAQIHGITTTRAVTEGVAPADALQTLADRIFHHHDLYNGQAAIVIYNARYDWPLLICEGERHGVDIPALASILDPMLIDRMVDQYRKGGRKLIQVAAHYGVPFDEADAHGAVADAVASGRIMRKLIGKYPIIADRSLATLWLRQVRGHESWRVGFEDYLKRKVNPDAEIASGWPLPDRAVAQAPAPAVVS